MTLLLRASLFTHIVGLDINNTHLMGLWGGLEGTVPVKGLPCAQRVKGA